MKTANFLTSACRYCRYYKPEGRRGGMCQMLGAPVQGTWKACALALSPFTPSWEEFEKMIKWPDEMPILSTSCTSDSALDNRSLAPTAQMASSTAGRNQAKPLLV